MCKSSERPQIQQPPSISVGLCLTTLDSASHSALPSCFRGTFLLFLQSRQTGSFPGDNCQTTSRAAPLPCVWPQDTSTGVQVGETSGQVLGASFLHWDHRVRRVTSFKGTHTHAASKHSWGPFLGGSPG